MEREYILRRFNREQLKLEDSEGSDFNRIVGMGTRLNPETHVKEPITLSYPSYWRNVVKAFKVLPINKYFGLTPPTAMELPFDRWIQIREAAREMKKNEPPDQEHLLIKLIESMLTSQGGGGS